MTVPTQDKLHGLRVMIAEDEWRIAELVHDILTGAGCVVIGPVATLADALRTIETQPMDGALLDVRLGEDHIRPAAEALTRRGIPFIITTGHRDPSMLKNLPPGAPVLTKPYKLQELKERMRTTFWPIEKEAKEEVF